MLDQKYQWSANSVNRDAKLVKINKSTQQKQRFTDWYASFSKSIADYRRLGGVFTDEQVLNMLERNASPFPVRAGAHSWQQRIETARELRHGDLEQVIEHLENLENKDTLSAPNYASYTRPAGRQFMKRINHDQIQQVLATLERKGTCWGCMEKGHFFLDKDENGEYVCKVARQRAANGDLPSPGTPGKTQPSHKSRHKTRRAYVTLDTEKHHTETSSEDEDNVNAPPAGATDDGTAPSEGSRSSDSEDEDHHLFQSIQYTFHTSWSHLYHGSPIQLDVPCLAVQRFLGQGEARHSTWIFDSASAMHVTGDSSVFLTPLRPSHILMEGSVPGITKETMIGTAKLRFRQPDGDYSPWIIIEDMHYIPGLKVNILSKNKMLKQICLACRCRRTSIRQHNGAYYTPQNWAIHTHERYLLDTVQVQFERDESPQSDPSITPPQFVSVYANLTPQPNITNRTRSADVKTRPVALPGGQSTAWKAAK